MQLSKSFIKALLPCVMACGQALGSPGMPTEPPVTSPAAVQPVAFHDHPTTQLTYAEWRRRLWDTRAGATTGTYQAIALNQPAASGLHI